MLWPLFRQTVGTTAISLDFWHSCYVDCQHGLHISQKINAHMQNSILDEGEFSGLIKTTDANDERGHNLSRDFRSAAEHVRSMLGM